MLIGIDRFYWDAARRIEPTNVKQNADFELILACKEEARVVNPKR
jgi:hypothetical protein